MPETISHLIFLSSPQFESMVCFAGRAHPRSRAYRNCDRRGYGHRGGGAGRRRRPRGEVGGCSGGGGGSDGNAACGGCPGACMIGGGSSQAPCGGCASAVTICAGAYALGQPRSAPARSAQLQRLQLLCPANTAVAAILDISDSLATSTMAAAEGVQTSPARSGICMMHANRACALARSKPCQRMLWQERQWACQVLSSGRCRRQHTVWPSRRPACNRAICHLRERAEGFDVLSSMLHGEVCQIRLCLHCVSACSAQCTYRYCTQAMGRIMHCQLHKAQSRLYSCMLYVARSGTAWLCVASLCSIPNL